jgi:FkbM family methyltransferase
VEAPRTQFTAYGAHMTIEGRDPGEYVFRRIRDGGTFYESTLLDALSYLPLRPDGLVVDAGANLGNHTLFFAVVLGLPVLAVEPEQANHDLLVRNADLNGVTDRVTVVRCALGAEPGTVTLAQRIEGNAGTFHTTPGGDTPVRRLDDLVDPDTPVALLKIDTEGDEPAVLAGARQILTRDHPFVCLEVHDGAAFRAASGLLGGLGYRLVEILGLSDNYLYGHPESCADLGEVITVAHRRADRQRHREVMSALTRLPGDVAKGLAGAGVESSRSTVPSRGSEPEKLMPKPSRASVDAHAITDPQEREQARLQRRAELWREAYTGLAASRPVQWARGARDLAGRVGLGRGGSGAVPPAARAERIEKLVLREFPEPSGPAKPAPRRGKIRSQAYTGDAVRVGIASIPSRRDGLQEVVSRLYDQVDDVRVYLNGYSEVPSFLEDDSKIEAVLGPDLGDRGKFAFLDDYDGYYFTADDDIAYPPFYVDHCLDGIERYGRRAVVGWHGSILEDPFEDYYDSASRRVFAFRNERRADVFTHVLGTGATAFHTDTIRPSLDLFTVPNMADVFFALEGQRREIPFVVLAHRKGWATPLELEDDTSISGESIAATPSRLNVRAETNRLVTSHSAWTVHTAEDVVRRAPLSLGLIGRVDPSRYRQGGGIMKSAHLTAEMLAPLGVDVRLFDLKADNLFDLGKFEPDVLVVYPGDPERPDFVNVIDVVEHHAGLGRTVAVNLSHDMRPERTAFIVDRLTDWDKRFPGLVHLLVFTDRVRDLPELREVRHRLFTMPKTLAVENHVRASFHQTEGVFLGDLGKLSDDRLLDQPVEAWIEAIRAALPGVPLYAVEQWRPRFEKNLDLEILPYLTDNFSERLSRMRLMVSPFRHCTFEMVPMELAGLGVPVVYRSMEQSLSDYLGLGGVEVSGPEDLATVLPTLYRDPTVWRGVSTSGASITAGLDRRRQAGQTYLRLLALRDRAGRRAG